MKRGPPWAIDFDAQSIVFVIAISSFLAAINFAIFGGRNFLSEGKAGIEETWPRGGDSEELWSRGGNVRGLKEARPASRRQCCLEEEPWPRGGQLEVVA